MYQQFNNTIDRSREELNQIINQVASCQDLTQSVIILHNLGLGSLFGFYPSQDRQDASMMIGTLSCAELGLPDRDYYLDAKHAEILSKYKQYIKQLLILWYQDEDKAVKNTELILKFETHLAQHSITKENRRKPELTYNMKNVSELPQIIDWSTYFSRCRTKINQIN